MDEYLKHARQCRLQNCFYLFFIAVTCDEVRLDDCMDNAQTVFDLCVTS